MFARASRRSLPRDGRRQSILLSEGIQLPFLCPALFGPRNLSKTTAPKKVPRDSHSHHSLRPIARVIRSVNSLPLPGHQRHLASAALAYEALPDEYVPFEGVLFAEEQQLQPPPPPPPPIRSKPTFPLPGYDSQASPLILEPPPPVPSGKFRTVDSVGGDVNEIHQNLHACLQVGRLERAQALIRRLKAIYKTEAPGLITAHNDYIREITLRTLRDPDPHLLKGLQQWFEVEIRQANIPPNATTYALLIQATSWGADPKAKGRGVRRYMYLAKEAGLLDETSELVSQLDESAQAALQSFLEEEDNEISKSIEDVGVQQVQSGKPFNSLPSIRSVEQKGLGLSTLKKQLSFLSEETSQEPRSTYMRELKADSRELSPQERQLALERNTLGAALERWREEDAQLRSQGVLNVLATRSLNAIMWQWHQALEPLIKQELKASLETEEKDTINKLDEDRLNWGPYLHGASSEKLSGLSILAGIREVSLQSNDDRGVKVINVVKSIGSTIQEECLPQNIKANKRYRRWHMLSQEGDRKKDKGTSARSPADSSRPSPSIEEFRKTGWPSSVQVRVGAVLLSRLVEAAKIEVSRIDPKSGNEVREEQPAFFHTFAYISGKRIGVIRLNPALTEIMTRAPLSPSLAKHLPMITHPKAWRGFKEGGYLEQDLPAVRLDHMDVLARRYAIAASSNGDMDQVFAGLDVLARTPWSINKAVFEVMVDAWNSGEEIASIPPDDPAIEIPPEPLPSAPVKDRAQWLKKVKEIENHKAGLKSQRCFLNFQLEVARAFLNETLYFPHNVDFRGRAYPMAPFLNHMGADNARGLLQFNEKKILGPSGLRWLKVHLANVYGFDKASFEEREKFAEDHLEDIKDAANNGIHGNRWWLSAEDPWQCLATCKDLKAALDLPDPTRHRSQLAIHQDGTCNGLQHYAALGGDAIGAKQVNLEPGDRPSDIYSAVAQIIKNEITEEAAAGDALAKLLDGKVTRKVVKQTVMTNVYGVTFVGAKRQVRKQLDNLLINFPNESMINKDRASSYVTKKIFKALATMFTGAHDIQYWFGDCAGRICNSLSPQQITNIERATNGEHPQSMFKMKPVGPGKYQGSQDFTTGVIWTTPLKMPVVQSYTKKTQEKIQTSFQNISIQNPSTIDPVNRAKQLQAFPPNFIHSLDGTHMFLTALRCDKVGLTFAAVHDSFWTHAGDVDTMNIIIREAFIKMHSENIIERLRAEFMARYKGYMSLASVHQSSVLGRKIRAWRRTQGMEEMTRATSSHRPAELLLEMKRLRLLSSEFAAKREEGREMVTPGSIYEQSTIPERHHATRPGIPTILGQTATRKSKLKANEELHVGNIQNAEPAATDEREQLLLDEEKEEEEAVEEDLEVAQDLESLSEDQMDAMTPDSPDQLAHHLKVGEVETTTVLSSEDKLDTTWIRQQQQRRRRQRIESVKKNAKTYVWVPLVFPPVPKKVCFLSSLF